MVSSNILESQIVFIGISHLDLIKIVFVRDCAVLNSRVLVAKGALCVERMLIGDGHGVIDSELCNPVRRGIGDADEND